jgi:hypothetical protein
LLKDHYSGNDKKASAESGTYCANPMGGSTLSKVNTRSDSAIFSQKYKRLSMKSEF